MAETSLRVLGVIVLEDIEGECCESMEKASGNGETTVDKEKEVETDETGCVLVQIFWDFCPVVGDSEASVSKTEKRLKRGET
jgi:hypothetical protein